jgi:tetratricopeptide (TPR) repeat protein/O-acetyl-ADP-ribose deacetylase (regulator of RNase III)
MNQQAHERIVRPHLIVGLGGTGQRILADVRARIVDRFGSLEAAPWIGFTAVDLEQQSMEIPRVVTIPTLRPNEFVSVNYVAQDATKLAQLIRSQPHLEKWFPKQALPNTRGFNLGAVSRRAMGRINFFLFYERIQQALLSARNELMSEEMAHRARQRGVSPSRDLCCFVVGSLAGDTCGGMFLDMAYLLQRCMFDVARNPREKSVSGIFLLPALEDSSSSGQQHANAFAALTELNHYSSPGAVFTAQYQAQEPEFHTESPPFECCYLLEPKGGVAGHRELLDLITVASRRILVEATTCLSVKLTEFRVNLLGTQHPEDPQAIYASFGFSALDFPQQRLIEECALRAAHDVIRQWLSPAQEHLQRSSAEDGERLLQAAGLGPEKLLREIRADELPVEDSNDSIIRKHFGPSIIDEALSRWKGGLPEFLREQSVRLSQRHGYGHMRMAATRGDTSHHSSPPTQMLARVERLMEGAAQRLEDQLAKALKGEWLCLRQTSAVLDSIRQQLRFYADELAQRQKEAWHEHHNALDRQRQTLDAVERAVPSMRFGILSGSRRGIIETYLRAAADAVCSLNTAHAATLAGRFYDPLLQFIDTLREELDQAGARLNLIQVDLSRQLEHADQSIECPDSHASRLQEIAQSAKQSLTGEALEEIRTEAVHRVGLMRRGALTEVELPEMLFRIARERFGRSHIPSPLEVFLDQQNPQQLKLLLDQMRAVAQPCVRLRPGMRPAQHTCWVGFPTGTHSTDEIQSILAGDAWHSEESVAVLPMPDTDQLFVLREVDNLQMRHFAALDVYQAAQQKRLAQEVNGYNGHTRSDIDWRLILASEGQSELAFAPEDIPALAQLRVKKCLIKVNVSSVVELAVNAVVCSRSRSLAQRLSSADSTHGAIQQAGGPGIDQEAERGGAIGHGTIRVTGAGALPAHHVVHAGIIDDLTGQPVTEAIVVSAVRAVLDECDRRRWRSVAIPLLGTRAGGLPQDKCVDLMFEEVYARAAQGREFPSVVVFCLRGFGGLARLVQRLTVLSERAAQEVPSPGGALIFISAKSADYTHAQKLYEYLISQGLHVFFSKESLPQLGDADYRRAIDRALDAAQHMIVVTTNRAHVESSWVEAEWGFFINEKRSGRKQGNLVTLTVGGLLPQELPPSLRYYEVVPAGHEAFERILSYVRRTETRQTSVETAPVAVSAMPDRSQNPHARAYHDRGVAHLRRKEIDQALVALSEAIRLDPTVAWAFNDRASALLQNSELTKAIADLSEGIRLDPSLAWPFHNRGTAHLKLENYAVAIEDFSEALKLDPTSAWSHHDRGVCHCHLGNYDAAIDDFTSTIQLNPTLVWAYRNRADAYEKIGKTDLAQADHQKVGQFERSIQP